MTSHTEGGPGYDRITEEYTERQLTLLDSERLQFNCNGEVDGLIAMIKDGGDLEFTKGTPPQGFEMGHIIKAAGCISRLVVREFRPNGRPRYHFATAFFVSETLLLTAGHNYADFDNTCTQWWITEPGISQIDVDDVGNEKIPLHRCTLVESLYPRGGKYWRDIAIFRCESYKSCQYVPLESATPPGNAIMDIIGCPAEVSDEWIGTHPRLQNTRKGRTDVEKALPKGSLLFTRGILEASFPRMSTMEYRLSTCPGMSGSCVLYDGHVVGVHIGRSDMAMGDCTMAVLFAGDIFRMLSENNVQVDKR